MKLEKKQQPQQNPKNNTKSSKQQVVQKLPDDMESEIRDCFNFYDPQKSGYINRQNLRSILGNFAFINKTVKDIEEEIHDVVDEQRDSFSLKDVMHIIQKDGLRIRAEMKRWMKSSIYLLKNRKIGLAEIKNVFGQYLDIQISESDILEFIQDASKGKEAMSKDDLASKMNYI